MDQTTYHYYQKNVESIFTRYESGADSGNTLLPHVFSQGQTVLDIGCGSGLEMSLLMRYGIDAYGLEPVEEFKRLSNQAHPELKGRIFTGSLPDNIPELPQQQFDGILLSAVLMHIPEGELFNTAYAVRSLLKPEGTLLVSVPLERDDIAAGGAVVSTRVDESAGTGVTFGTASAAGSAGQGETAGPDGFHKTEKFEGPEKPAGTPLETRDTSGRLMIIRPEARIRILFERLGFDTESRYYSADRLGRTGIRWVSLVFRYRGGGVSESVDKIESIINQDKKTATYKLALLRGLCDIAQQEAHTAVWDARGNVHLPMSSVVRKWIEYYWPIVESPDFIPQMRGEQRGAARFIGFRRNLSKLAGVYRDLGGIEQFVVDRDAGRIPAQALSLLNAARAEIKKAIQQPIYYAGGGKSDEKPFSYDAKGGHIILGADLWRELLLLGHIISDNLLLRWAELTNDISKQNVPISRMVELLLTPIYPLRNVGDARGIYLQADSLECVWTGAALHKNFDVDHAIPYSLRHDNSLWNLLPADPAVNNQKRDKVPAAVLVETRRDSILYYWEMLKAELPERFGADYRRITGLEYLSPDSWHRDLFTVFQEVLETTAVTRSTPRWYA